MGGEQTENSCARCGVADPLLDRIVGELLLRLDDTISAHRWEYTVIGLHRTLVVEGLQLLQTHINFPRFLPIFPDFLERLSH
jgi:hypothetical protein